MGDALYLQEARNIIAEPGVGLHYDFGTGRHKAVKDLRSKGWFLGGAFYEPVGGHFMGHPTYTLNAHNPAAWDTTGTYIGLAMAHWQPAGTPVAFASMSGATWSASTKLVAAAGQGFYVSLVTYETQKDAGGEGTGSPLTMRFGGVWKLELYDNGDAILYQTDATDPVTGAVYEAVRAKFEWMTADRFADKAPIPHWLWVYEVGAKLVIRNLSQGLNGRYCGCVYVDPTAVPDTAGATVTPVMVPGQAGGSAPYYPVDHGDEQTTPLKHALRPGKWTISGGGRLAWNWSSETFVAQEERIGQADPATISDIGSTRECQVLLSGQGGVAPLIETFDETQQAWPQGTGSTSPAVRYALAWEVSWTSTATATFYLSAVDVKIDPLYSADGNTGTDVIALTNVADKQISLSREGDLTRERLNATFQTWHVDLATYCQPNMMVRYVVGTTTVFRGLTDRADWNIDADSNPATGRLVLSAEGLWRRFRKSLWPGGSPFDGRLLTDCLAEVLAAAGLAPTEYSLAAWAYRFPLPEPGEPPAIVYRPGTSIDRILEDLQRKFYGTGYVHYFRLSDGLFVLAPTATGSAVASFYQTTAAAATAGLPYQTIRQPQQTLDDSEQYNSVLVIGETTAGRDGATSPIIARATDWPSVNDPTAFNYVGELWPLVVADPGLKTQAAVNWVCRSLFDRHRNPRVNMQWQSLRVNLFPGEVVALVGGNYGYNVKLTGVTLTKATTGAAGAPAGLASYQGEVLS